MDASSLSQILQTHLHTLQLNKACNFIGQSYDWQSEVAI